MGFFDNLNDDLNAAPVRKERAERPTYTSACPKCRGSGRFYGYSGRDFGPCHMCKGAGQMTFKTSPEHRAKARAGSAKRKADAEAAAAANAVEWAAAHPDVCEWLARASARGFNFAISLSQALAKYGHLTEGQIGAARKCMVRDAEFEQKRHAERLARTEAAPAVSVESIEQALRTATGNGLKNPKLRLADFVFSLAKASSRNAGAIYVKQGSDYLGKIAGGKFFCARECGAEREAKVVEVASQPAEAAVAYGRMTGSCACCGRELTDPESIERGIGPICARKFGF